MLALAEPPLAAARPGCKTAAWVRALREGALLALDPTPLPVTVREAGARIARHLPQSRRQTVSVPTMSAELGNELLQLGAAATDRDRLVAALAPPLCVALEVLGVDEALLRLEIVHTQTCPKLHVDRLRWRLCCTLSGEGTEYLPAGVQPMASHSRPVLRLPTGILAGMAGALAGPGLWHRSPHACPDHPRLFLSLDVG
jgi:hypothetical protein